MSKYIDAEKLKAEIERQEKQCPLDTYEGRYKLYILGGLKTFISTLEVEKPVGEELEKEIEKTWLEYECYNEDYDKVAEMRWNEFENIARHFAQWGAEHARE